MAKTYIECDGNNTRSMTVDTSMSPLYYRQYTQGDTIITESYKKMTFTCNPAPISSSGLRINYAYEVAYSYDGSTPTNYYLTPASVIMAQGQTSKVVDVPITKERCFSDGIQEIREAI
jgi:hypothetical protein